MANTIKHKRTSVAGSVPSSLSLGELAINSTDGKVFTRKDTGGVTSIIEIGGGGPKGGGSDAWAIEHDNTITQSYTIGNGKNVISAGPLTVNSGATVTVPSGSNWVIV